MILAWEDLRRLRQEVEPVYARIGEVTLAKMSAYVSPAGSGTWLLPGTNASWLVRSRVPVRR